MARITAGPAIIEQIRKAKAEGKALTPLAQKLLNEAEEVKSIKGSKKKLGAALYLLGASLSQLSVQLGITRATAWTYVKENIPLTLRQKASEQRDFGRSGPLIEMAGIEEYCQTFTAHPELKGQDSVTIAAKLKQIVHSPEPDVDTMEAPTDEPY